LWSHLKNNHKEIHDALEKLPAKRKASSTNENEPAVIPAKTRRTHDAETSIMKMIARRNAPFTLLDDDLFRRMMSKTFVNVGLRGSRHFSRTVLPRVAGEVLNKLRNEVGGNLFAITTDGWSAINKPAPSYYR
jgi:hypothetical protein